MSDTGVKISQLDPLLTADNDDLIPIVDVSDTSTAASGKTKNIKKGDLFPQQVLIPQPQIGFQHNYNTPTNPISLYAWFHNDIGYLDGKHPKIFLFVYRTRKRRKVIDIVKDISRNVTLPYANRFVHPAHLGQVNYPGSAFFNGSYNADAAKYPETEWGIDSDYYQPFKKNQVQLQPWRFFGLTDDDNAAQGWPVVAHDDPDQTDFGPEVRGNGRTRQNGLSITSSKALYCKVALAIDNPAYDAGDPAKKYAIPKVIGPMSDTFALYPKIKYLYHADSDMNRRQFVGWAARIGTTIR